MSEQICSAILGGVSGAIVSGIIYFILDKRREHRNTNKFKQSRNDLIIVIKKLPSYQKEQKLLDNISKELGDHRFKKIGSALEAINIMKIKPTSGGWIFSLMSGFLSYTDQDIKTIIKDIKKGFYDNCFSPNGF